MSKTFYTERDIEILAGQGVSSLVVNDDVVITDVAREKARRLGVELVREHDTPSSAPIRPYIAAKVKPKPSKEKSASSPDDDLRQRVLSAVRARLGDSVDAKLLDTIVKRVLRNVETK